MRIEARRWSAGGGWTSRPGELRAAQLVLAFASTDACARTELFDDLAHAYPSAEILGCSTAGEILGTQVTDDTLVAAAVEFDGTTIQSARVGIDDPADSFAAGLRLARALPHEDLVHVLVFSEGLKVNGSELVKGLAAGLPRTVTVTGGLSGDGVRFANTYVVWKGRPERGSIVAAGLYGKSLRVGYASLGGWDSFGPERLITRSRDNVLYELDGRSALELYKQYLGDHAADLPASGLLFPLSLRTSRDAMPVVRTILAVDENEQSMTFAGDVPTGAYARLMKANFDRLIDGAAGAAKVSYDAVGTKSPHLALLISCVGRKMVLQQRIEEEVEGVRDVMGDRTVLAGFYSYGEISPFTPSARCELHNQTMTITTFSEPFGATGTSS
ncbi:MAG TPA: FIST N-terminal domain-containing protein [Thermoanaerobaculia bacterium]|nr:FIST N-terminal domain-containing protein [Thermoanaerobaculia bacterium]